MTSGPANILIVTDTLQAGGAERVVSDMANYWADAGLRITVLTLKSAKVADYYQLSDRVDRQYLNAGDVPTSALGKLPGIYSRVRQLRGAFKRIAPDTIISFIDVPNILTIIAALGLSSRVVVSERGCPDVAARHPEMANHFALGGHWRFLRRRLYRYADVVTALNAGTAEWLAGECGTEVAVVPNAIRPMPIIDTPREKTIVGIGRQQKIKGFDLLVESFARVADSHRTWSLVLIGDGPERAALEQQAQALGLSARVRFVAKQTEIEPWMARAGIVVSPSRSEAFGNVVLESMAMGAPIVCTACAGPSSIVENGVDGILVPVADVAAMADAIARLIENPEMRRYLGRRARSVREKYSQAAVMPLWNKLMHT